MYHIKLIRRAPGVDDLYLVSGGAKRLRVMSVWEYACKPLRDTCKAYKTPAAALAALAKAGLTDTAGNPLAPLSSNGVTAVEIIPA